MNYLSAGTFLVTLFLIACSNASPTTSEDTSTAFRSSKSSETSCLEKYAEKPCDILSIEEIITLAGQDPSKVKINQSQNLEMLKRQDCAYLWNSGRMEKIKTAAGNFDSELNDLINVGQFRTYDKSKTKMTVEQWFDSSYPMPSKEEIAAREASYNERVAKGEKDLIEKMTIKNFKEMDRNRIDGLGDRAITDTHVKFSSGTVSVLHKNVVFQVTVDVSKDKAKNLDVAKTIAKAVMDICN